MKAKSHNIDMEQQSQATTTARSEVKQTSIRWPGDFWEAVAIEATKRRTSVNAIVTEAVAQYLNIEAPKAA